MLKDVFTSHKLQGYAYEQQNHFRLKPSIFSHVFFSNIEQGFKKSFIQGKIQIQQNLNKDLLSTRKAKF